MESDRRKKAAGGEARDEAVEESGPRPLRIFAFADWHGGWDWSGAPEEAKWRLFERIEEAAPDVVISVGDHTVWSRVPPEFYERMAEAATRGARLMHVFGNHESGGPRLDYAHLLPQSADLTHTVVRLGEAIYYGYDVESWSLSDELARCGDPWLPGRRLIGKVVEAIRLVKPKFRIMACHEPPEGYISKARHSCRIGDPVVRKILDETVPTLCLAGHLHEPEGRTHTLEMGRTLVVNPGPYGTLVEL
jgi:predicted phosphodiesterase